MSEKCELCKGSFEIEKAYIELASRLAPVFDGKKYEFLLPKFCPTCRQRERVAFRNENTLYKRKCDLTGEHVVALYPADSPYKVYSQEAFWSDKWNAKDYGRDFDFSHTFFDQFKDLMLAVPRLSIVNKQSENSDYCNYSFANKNCYLLFGSHYEEDCLYGGYSTKNKNCMDYFWLYQCELCYESAFSNNCYKCAFIERSEQCNDCYFCYDLKGCKNCLFSYGLRNKQYSIFNESKSKEEYEAYFAKLKMSSHVQLEKLKEGWEKFRRENVIYKAVYQVNCQNCEGTNHQNSKNLKHCFACSDCEDCIYGSQMDATVSSLDCSQMGYDPCELCYNVIGHNGAFHSICCDSCWHSSDIYYCNLCFSSKNCFGCIGMRQNEYCILNKQYTKDEFEKMAAKIAQHMIKTGEWGKFFTSELRPFAYNESVANDFFPMTKEEVKSIGFAWKDDIDHFEEAPSDYKISDSIEDVDDDILSKVLTCDVSGRPYKIVKQELNFYRKMNLPVPKVAPKERLTCRFKFKAQHVLFERKCSNCGLDLKTVFDEKFAKKIYCDKCYLSQTY